MADRMREVVGKHSTWYQCDEHDWDFTNTEGDVCPVCKGEAIAEERIIKLLEDPAVMSNWWSQVDKNLGLYGNLKNYVIALIKGEQVDHIGEAIRATAWAYTEGERPNPLIKGEK